MKKILVLGATGLIGHQVYLRLSTNKSFKVFSLARQRKITDSTILLDARDEHTLESTIRDLSPDIIVNCMGVLIAEANANPEHAIFLNAYTPHRLSSIANSLDSKLVHISTDCVFSGKKGTYVESDIKDADDVYGRAKALGEVTESPHLTLRTSVVGPELKEGEELFHWFMCQKGTINGFTQSIWSGVTTLELAKAVEWAILGEIQGLYHITNGTTIDKFRLLSLFKKHTGRDVVIEGIPGRETDKSFVDTRKELNYIIPEYDVMIEEMVAFMRENASLYPLYSIGEV